MTRSKWKLDFIDKEIFKCEEFEDRNKLRRYLNKKVSVFRRSTITESFIDQCVFLHNGKNFPGVVIKKNQIGLKFGDIVCTKQIGSSMHLYNKIQKKNKEKKRLLKQKKLNRNKIKKKVKKKLKKK